MDSLVAYVKKRPVRSALGVVLALILVFALSVMLQTPRADRNWNEHLATMPAIEMSDAGFKLGPAIDWTYDEDGPVEKTTVHFAANYAGLRDVWFMVEPQPGGDYAAHTLVLFEFTNDRMIGLSVEARLEEGETYDAVQGALNKYELAYSWGTAKEFLTRRAVYLKKEIYVYPLQLTPEQKLAFLKATLEKTIEISAHPRFYNTFTSNCTNELAKTAGLGWHYSWVLTGYSPQHLFETKMIPGADFETAKRNADLTRQIRAWNPLMSSAQFTTALIAELHVRNGKAE